MKKYIVFIVKCIVAMAPLIAIVAYTLLFPFAYMDEEYPAWEYSRNVASGEEGEEKYRTVILGDSGAMSSFVPEYLSDDCVNMAVGGGTVIEMYYFMKEYLDNHEAPENVVIMFSPFHYMHMDNFETRTRYFKALSLEDMRELCNYARECDAQRIYYPDFYQDECAYRLGLPTKYLPALTASHFYGRYESNQKRYDELKEARGYGEFGQLEGCSDLSYECTYTALDYGSELDLLGIYFYLLSNMCRENGIRVQLLQQAFNESSYNELNENYVNNYMAYIDLINDRYGFDCEREFRCYPNELFGDVSHLNRKGAIIFSQEIKEEYPDIF